MNALNAQKATPLLTALRDAASRSNAAFYTPGHKRGQGTPAALVDLLGTAVFRADLPELPELDNLFAPEGAIAEAQALAAAAFGAKQSWFLVNGSTCGIAAAMLATCRPGDKIVLPRNVHQSAIAALILSGAVPIFVEPEYNAHLDLAHSLTPAGVAAALDQHPDAKAVMMLYPTYYGVCGDVTAIAQIAHQHRIPLLVDEAHAPHFAFHPDLPIAALAAGADLVVQSIHKVLSAFTQAAILHIQGDSVNAERVSRALQLVQSTSPSYLLLASLDAARQQMATQGKDLLSRTLALADRARTEIAAIAGLTVLSTSAAGQTPGFFALDRTRLTVTVSGLGLTGFEADEILHNQLGVTAELPSLQHLTFIITLGNTEQDIDRLILAFQTLAQRDRRQPLASKQPLWNLPSLNAPSRLTPRDAYFAASESVPIAQAVDRISAELVCPYPPGIPLLMPGEQITQAALNYLKAVVEAGGVVTGVADAALQTLKVVKQESN
jgi:arginine decarboxylase